MKIQIKHRWKKEVIYEGDYTSVKEAVVKAVKEGSDLGFANLEGSNLEGSNLGFAKLKGSNLRFANLEGSNLEGSNLRFANLEGSDLGFANLEGSNLGGAKLIGANLGFANLEGAKEYKNSHDFFMEILRRKEIKEITKSEWSMIGELTIHRFCWDKIRERFGKKCIPLLKKLKKWGYSEFLEEYKMGG